MAKSKAKKDKPKIFVKRHGSMLAPAGYTDEMAISKLPWGDVLVIDKPIQPRDLLRLRVYWAFCRLVSRALNAGPAARSAWSEEDVSDNLKEAVGHADIERLAPAMVERTGVTHRLVTRSISRAAMPDERDFIRFMDAAFAYVETSLCPWIMNGDDRHKIEALIQKWRHEEADA